MTRKGHFPRATTKITIQGNLVEIDTLVGVMDKTTGAIMHHMSLDRARLFCMSQAVMGDNRFRVVKIGSGVKGSRRKGFIGGWKHIGDDKANAIREEINKRPETMGKLTQIAKDFDVNVRLVYSIKHGRHWKVDNGQTS